MRDQTLDHIKEDPLMSPDAFDLAIEGLSLAQVTKKAAYLVLVEDMSRTEAREQTGAAADTLNKALARIAKNFKQQLADGNLVFAQRVTTPEMDAALASQEALIVESRINKSGRRKRK